MNRVTTTSTCGRCGAQEVQNGDRVEPPTGWATVIMNGSSAAGRFGLFCDAICPACQEVVLEALKPPVDRIAQPEHMRMPDTLVVTLPGGAPNA